MGLVVNRKYSGYRLDHPDFGDVLKSTFQEGEILEMGMSSLDPISPSGRCTVQIVVGQDSGTFEEIPLFYHCPEDPWNPEIGKPEINNIVSPLNGAGWAYRAGDKVKVMLQENYPVAILGQMDPLKAPIGYGGNVYGAKAGLRRCKALFRVCVDALSNQGGGIPQGDFYETTFSYIDAFNQEIFESYKLRGTFPQANPVYDAWGKNIESSGPGLYSPDYCGMTGRILTHPLQNDGSKGASTDYIILVGPVIFILRFWNNTVRHDDFDTYSSDAVIMAGPYTKDIAQSIVNIGYDTVTGFPAYPGMTLQSGLTTRLFGDYERSIDVGVGHELYGPSITTIQGRCFYPQNDDPWPIPDGPSSPFKRTLYKM